MQENSTSWQNDAVELVQDMKWHCKLCVYP